jgi:membrane protein implicated in regulation of membrane protease activity
MVGALFLAVPMHGGEFIALMMMKAVGAVSFALPVFGVRLKIQRVTPAPFDALSTTASSKSLEPN